MVNEYILCAANWYNDGKEHVHQPVNIPNGFVICGHRHGNCISIFALMVGFPYDENGLILRRTEEQGFLTNKNRFVTRKEALEIARIANQILDESEVRSVGLHSEDLY